jgi:hypothetical protein
VLEIAGRELNRTSVDARAYFGDLKVVALCAGVVQDHLLRGICRVED